MLKRIFNENNSDVLSINTIHAQQTNNFNITMKICKKHSYINMKSLLRFVHWHDTVKSVITNTLRFYF